MAKIILSIRTVLYLLLGGLAISLPSQAVANSYESLVADLNAKKYAVKAEAIQAIAASKDTRSLSILSAMLNGKLFYLKPLKKIVFSETSKDNDSEVIPIDVLSGESLAPIGKRKVKKVRVNNKIRKYLRSAIATMQLTNEDRDTRFQAASNLAKNMQAAMLPIVEQALATEQDQDIIHTLKTAVAIINIKDPDPQLRLSAIQQLNGNLDSAVIALLSEMINGNEAEQNPEVLAATQKALAKAESQIKLSSIAENLFFGISLGSVLLLTAVGLAITFGVMGVINMAHGEMMMLGAYTTYVIQQAFPEHINISVIVAIPAAFVVAGLVGIVIERGVIRHLYGRPLETLLATFGISLILQQTVRSIFGPTNMPVSTPDWLSGSLHINNALSLTYNRIYIILFSLLVLAALVLLLKKTFFGLQMRAVTQNRKMANSMGIRSSWIDALTFGLGSGIAGIAGVALSQLTNVGPNLGQQYIIDSFMVVVFGGVGNLFGTFFAAMSLGITNKIAEPFIGAVLAKIFILIFIILFIQRRPRGLFAIQGRSVED